jgi:hypothetical protein
MLPCFPPKFHHVPLFPHQDFTMFPCSPPRFHHVPLFPQLKYSLVPYDRSWRCSLVPIPKYALFLCSLETPGTPSIMSSLETIFFILSSTCKLSRHGIRSIWHWRDWVRHCGSETPNVGRRRSRYTSFSIKRWFFYCVQFFGSLMSLLVSHSPFGGSQR